MHDEDLNICMSCCYNPICAKMFGGEPLAYDCGAYAPKEYNGSIEKIPEPATTHEVQVVCQNYK